LSFKASQCQGKVFFFFFFIFLIFKNWNFSFQIRKFSQIYAREKKNSNVFSKFLLKNNEKWTWKIGSYKMRDHLNDTTLANHCDQPIKTSHSLFLNLLENIVVWILTSPKFNFTWFRRSLYWCQWRWSYPSFF
jgi:hypothetical protein